MWFGRYMPRLSRVCCTSAQLRQSGVGLTAGESSLRMTAPRVSTWMTWALGMGTSGMVGDNSLSHRYTGFTFPTADTDIFRDDSRDLPRYSRHLNNRWFDAHAAFR